MRHALLAIAIVAADPTAVARASQGQPTTPTFGTRVEVLLLDVPVSDDTGRPVRGLGRDDFIVQVGGEPQRVAAADLVTDVAGVSRGDDTPAVSSNVGADRPVLVIATDLQGDVSSAQRVLSRLASRLDEVHPSIPIGLASLSDVAARVPPGFDRAVVKDALRNELRSANGLQADAGLRKFDVTLGDSWRIVAGDRRLLQEAQARECADASEREICGHEVEASVRSAVEVARGRAETAVSRLTAVVEDLGRRPGRKDLLLW